MNLKQNVKLNRDYHQNSFKIIKRQKFLLLLFNIRERFCRALKCSTLDMESYSEPYSAFDFSLTDTLSWLYVFPTFPLGVLLVLETTKCSRYSFPALLYSVYCLHVNRVTWCRRPASSVRYVFYSLLYIRFHLRKVKMAIKLKLPHRDVLPTRCLL